MRISRIALLASSAAGIVALTALPSSAQASQVDQAAAQAVVAHYQQSPTPFPVTEPLKTLPTGKKIAVLDCGSPVCGMFSELVTAPAADLGMQVTRIRSGTTTDGVAAAFDTVLTGGFDGVFVPAIAPSLWGRYLDELNAARIPVVTTGIIGLDRTKVPVSMAAEPSSAANSFVLANWAVAQDGAATKVAFYRTPEISFTNFMADAFVETMNKICGTCEVRVVDVPVSSFGNNAPTIVVDDLLAHPGTTAAVFSVGEQAIGLPSALKVADIKIRMAVNSPDPAVLAGIEAGTYDVGLGVDTPALVWTLMDSLARVTTGQEPAAGAVADEMVRQVLTAKNLSGDMKDGWVGYPDYVEQFHRLWGVVN